MRRKANAGVPIVLPVGGKRVLAQIAWPNDESLQARFVKAGRRNPYGLSREEYFQLASNGSDRTNDGFMIDLLEAWAIRAAKREPELAKHQERLLQLFFTDQFVEFLLGRRVDVTQFSGEPQEIIRDYLFLQNWKHTVELLALERQLSTPRRKGTESWVDRRKLVHDEIRAVAEKIKHPLLNRSQAKLIDQIRHAPELLDEESGEPLHSRSTVRRALAKSKAQP